MILDKIVEDKKLRLKEHKARVGEEEMRELALESTRTSVSFYDALSKPGLSIIGEFKKASPSLGNIDSKIDLGERITQYNASVDAISCLTEEDHFHGNAEYLKEIRGMSPLPVLRKDFIIDTYQIYEAKVIGADAILLIAAILDNEKMHQFYELATKLGLDCLVEVHDQKELERAVSLGAKIIGVNNRDLRDFTIKLSTTKDLSAHLDELTGGKRPVFVSESGVTEDAHIEFLHQCKVNALLIGRAFMEAENPQELANHWKTIFAAC